MIRLRYLCEIFTGNQDTQDNVSDGIYPFYVRSPIVEKSNKYTFEGPAILMAGDGVGAGKIFHYVDGKYGCHQRVYSLQHIHNVNRRYLYYYLQNLFYISIETANTKSTVDSVRLSMLQDFPIAMPTFEQQQIADFLDEKVSQIDSTISKTRESIEEYKKLKQSIITEVVTGNVKIENGKVCGKYDTYKDSGIEWIGEIPSEWDCFYLSQIFSPVKNKNIGMQETNLLSLSYGKIIRKNIETTFGLLPENFEGYNIIERDNIVLRLTDLQNDHKSLRVGLVTEKGIITSAYLTLKNKTNMSSNYFYYLLHSFDIAKGFYGMGAGVRQGLNWNEIRSLRIISPKESFDQQQISDFLDKKCSEIDKLITKKEQLVVELESYKKSLIYEVVTGKKECVK